VRRDLKTGALLLVLMTGLTGCGGDDPTKPYLKIQGGGFVFNYRYATLSYGFVAKPLKPLPEGSQLAASFDMPDGTQRYTTALPTQAGKLTYAFETPPLKGVVKGKPYRVTLRLLDAETGKELAKLEQDYRTDTDQAELPSKAPVKGVGYDPAP
jgi:hypothetical protein